MTQPMMTEPTAADMRRRAGGVLDDGRGIRLTLVLAVVVVLTATVGAYILGEAVYGLGFLLLGESVWADVAAYAVMGALGLFGVLPLMMGAYRLACLSYPPRRGDETLPVVASSTVAPALADLFYPFTSLRAYGRTFALVLGFLGWLTLAVAVPAVGFRALSLLLTYAVEEGMLEAALRGPLTLLGGILCLAFGILMLFLSGYRAGFSYLAFVHEPLSLGEVSRYFKGFRRSFIRPFVLRVSLLGWVAVSILAVLVPFVAHTIPYGMCCGAVYGAELRRK